MMKTYSYEWFGIKFNSFTISSHRKLADAKFYNDFYKEFYNHFQSYEDLPESYRKSKNEIADFLFEIVKDKNKILSIGCGNCYIEQRLSNLLLKNNEQPVKFGQTITAIDPGINLSSIWLKAQNVKLLKGYFPDDLKTIEKFDICYASNIDYTFTDELYFKFLKSIVDFGMKDFILTDVITPPSLPINVHIKNIIKDVLSDLNLYETRQFWGYLRTINEHEAFFRKAGFSYIEVGEFNNGSKFLRARND